MRTPERLGSELENDIALLESVPEQRRELLPVVAVVGRPNVGKSTFYNRITGRRQALVHEQAGMTRDRRMEVVDWIDNKFLVVDTGGFDPDLDDPLLSHVVEQARIAVQEADVLVLLTEIGLTEHPAEEKLIDYLRRSGKPVIVAVNKCDNQKLAAQAHDFYRYGFEDIHPISALHGRGVSDLLDSVNEQVSKTVPTRRERPSGGISVALVGRRNVGKSSLLNRLTGEERVIANSLPGTTRDAIDTAIQTPDGDVFTLIDTAGIRRRGKVERGIGKIDGSEFTHGDSTCRCRRHCH